MYGLGVDFIGCCAREDAKAASTSELSMRLSWAEAGQRCFGDGRSLMCTRRRAIATTPHADITFQHRDTS
jgi:hypothetical protein